MKILNQELVEVIDNYLNSFKYGEVIIIKHENKIAIDVKVRDRRYLYRLDK
jgi:hypothetical protein